METRALKAQLKAQRDSDRAAVRVAETQLKAAREGKLFSPSRIRRAADGHPAVGAGGRTARLSRLHQPHAVSIDERRADRLGVPLSQIGQFSGHGAELSARIAGAEQSLRAVLEKKPKDAETKQFVAAMNDRLGDLSAAVTAAENMPTAQRRPAHAAIAAATRRHRGRSARPPRRGLTHCRSHDSRPANPAARTAGYGRGTVDRRTGRRRPRGGQRRASDRGHRRPNSYSWPRPSARWPPLSPAPPTPRVLLALLGRRPTPRTPHAERCGARTLDSRIPTRRGDADRPPDGDRGRGDADRGRGSVVLRGVARRAGRRPDPGPVVPAPPAVAAGGADQPLRSSLLLAASVSHRGPPVSLAR